MAVIATVRSGSTRELEALLVGLALQSWVQLTDPMLAPRIPPLYSGHYRYANEPRGREQWQSALENAALGLADCEDLCTHRVAEYWRDGIRAMPRVIAINDGLKHVVVELPDGSLEDPSQRLGMPV